MAELSGVVGISIVKNEADILEPMLRHNLQFLDHLVVIDNNSGDGTSEIIEAMSNEFPGRLVRQHDGRIGHVQTQAINDVCLAHSGNENIACFLPLDADELIVADKDVFRSNLLSEKRPIVMPWITYVPTREDDLAEQNPIIRITHRRRKEPLPYTKTTFPRHLVGRARLAAGNHELHSAEDLDPQTVEGLSLAHFPVRSKEQLWAKTVIGALNLRLRKFDRAEGFQWHELSKTILKDKGVSDDVFFATAQGYAVGTCEVELMKDPLRVSSDIRELRYPVASPDALATKLSIFAEECINWFMPNSIGQKRRKNQPSPDHSESRLQVASANTDEKQPFDWRRSIVRRLGYEPVPSNDHIQFVNSIHRTRSHFGNLLFSVHDKRDIIQSHHYKGEVYEPEELQIIQQNFDGGHFLDIGANVGNHTVCIGSLDRTDQVTAIEPNPDALVLLAQNVALNGLWRKTTIRNMAFSDAPGKGTLTVPVGNKGAAALSVPRGYYKVEKKVDVVLERGDAIIAPSSVDFVKMDVEGHELACLNGLRTTILANRPPVFLEVANGDRAAVEGWFTDIDYTVTADFRRYKETINLLFKPSGDHA